MLTVAAVPEGAINLNVEGRRLTSPIQGFGKMWQKTYRVAIPSQRASAAELIATWKQRFPEFWPEGNRFYGPLTGIAPGDVALLNLTLPGRMKLSTGVMVLYADDESFTLMTPEGHTFSGWITFSASESDGQTTAQAQVLMRASDPIYELGLAMGGHGQENRFWEATLTRLAAHFGYDGRVDTNVTCGPQASVGEVEQRVAQCGHPLDDLHGRNAGTRAQAPAEPRPDGWLRRW
jgi:hypothetical protein